MKFVLNKTEIFFLIVFLACAIGAAILYATYIGNKSGASEVTLPSQPPTATPLCPSGSAYTYDQSLNICTSSAITCNPGWTYSTTKFTCVNQPANKKEAPLPDETPSCPTVPSPGYGVYVGKPTGLCEAPIHCLSGYVLEGKSCLLTSLPTPKATNTPAPTTSATSVSTPSASPRVLVTTAPSSQASMLPETTSTPR